MKATTKILLYTKRNPKIEKGVILSYTSKEYRIEGIRNIKKKIQRYNNNVGEKHTSNFNGLT